MNEYESAVALVFLFFSLTVLLSVVFLLTLKEYTVMEKKYTKIRRKYNKLCDYLEEKGGSK